MLGCAGVAAVATVFVLSGDSPGNGGESSTDKTTGTSGQGLSYRIPSDFCNDKIVSIFEGIPNYKPGYSKEFEEVEIDADAPDIVDKTRCAARSVDAGVDAYLFESSEAAAQFYDKNIDREMYELEVQDLDKSEWTQGAFGFGIELSKPGGVVVAQKDRLVVGTSAKLDDSGSTSEETLREKFGEALTEIAREAESQCRK